MESRIGEFENRWDVAATRSQTTLKDVNAAAAMGNDEALVLAAWLVMKAEPYAELTFIEVQREVRDVVQRLHSHQE